jgi:hypothetical protein
LKKLVLCDSNKNVLKRLKFNFFFASSSGIEITEIQVEFAGCSNLRVFSESLVALSDAFLKKQSSSSRSVSAGQKEYNQISFGGML